jgi:linoleoyl-CoA desaturase
LSQSISTGAQAVSPALNLSPQNVRFGLGDAFQKAMKAKVDRYFRYTGKAQRDCPQMYTKTAIILAWFIGAYVLLMMANSWWVALPLAMVLGLAFAAIGFNIQHDGGHRAYSDRPWVNRLMAMSLDMIGGSSYIWDHKHNTIHHTYANITGHDDDIEVGFLGRLSPHQKRHRFHRVQHFYLWALYGFLPVKWQLFDDYWNLARARIGTHKFARPKGWNLVIFIGGKVLFLSLAFVIPALFHPILDVILVYLAAMWVNGITLAVVFQLAHVVEEAEFPMPDPASGRIESQWAIHQVQTTVDFARGNRLLSWFLGGLNFQIEHHLFPRICHVHYHRLSRVVERTCKDFGLQYNAHRSVFSAIASHFRWLRKMGQPV